MRDLISIKHLSKKEIENLLAAAAKMELLLKKGGSASLKGKLVANLFFEPSTRTNLSFQAAAQRLGAGTLVFSSQASSAAKGESLADTVRIVDGYADCIVIRHPDAGSALLAAEVASHPVINAGDGGNEHPTQTLIDLYTIKKLKKKLSGLSICLAGDLKHARTQRSLLYALAMFGADVSLYSPTGLEMDRAVLDSVRKKFGARPKILSSLTLMGLDVLYVTRIQKERFASADEALRMQKAFVVSPSLLAGAKKDLIIMQPLPRTTEIPQSIDRDSRAKYFEQAKNGVPVRMAILEFCMKGGKQ